MRKNDAIKALRAQVLAGGGAAIRLEWSTSTRADTYGYRELTARYAGAEIAYANGGGYDMAGTVLGDVITAAFTPELKAPELQPAKLYGLMEYNGRRYIDGGCGETSVQAIAAAIGLVVLETKRSTRSINYLIKKNK